MKKPPVVVIGFVSATVLFYAVTIARGFRVGVNGTVRPKNTGHKDHHVDDVSEYDTFFVDHAAAVKIPTKVMCFTTSDLYREGFRQNCDNLLSAHRAYLLNNSNTLAVTTYSDEQRLTCALLHNYSHAARPVINPKSILVVNFSLAINQIFDLDDRNQVLTLNVWFEQTWLDEFLHWNPEDFGGLTTLNVPSFYLFIPDIELYNTAADYTKKRAQFRTMVSSDGVVFYGNPVKLHSTCQINPTFFPFDTQICHLKFGSWTHSGLEIDLQPSRDGVDLSRLVINGKWDIVDVVQKRHSILYTCCPEPYIDISYYLILQRKPLYYLLNVYFFTVMLAVMTIAVYQLPIDSGEKCSLGTAVLFSISVFMLSLGEKLPESSDYVPIIFVYLFLVMAMSALSLMITIGVNAIHYQHTQVDSNTKKLFLSPVPRPFMWLLRVYRRRQGVWMAASVQAKVDKYNQKKEFINKLRSYHRSIDYEMRHFSDPRAPEELPETENATSMTLPLLLKKRKAKQKRSSIDVQLEALNDAVNGNFADIVTTLNDINFAIERLADAYEAQIDRAFIILDWHQLAVVLDGILFWIFLVLNSAILVFVFGMASITQYTVDRQNLIDSFEQKQ